MTRQKLWLALSLLARTGTGLISLLLLARGLGPADYGFIATVFAWSSIAALLTDFGFSVQALRDIGAQPRRAGAILAACIRIKNLLVAGTSIVAAAALLFLDIELSLRLAGVLLYGSLIVMSYGDLAMVALRGVARYDAEARAVIAGMLLYMVVVGGVALISPAILPVALAIAVARLVQTGICFAVLRRHVTLGNCLFGPPSEALRFMRNSSALALDSMLTTASAQIDTILVSAMLGLEAAGIYQVAARVAGYAVLPIQVLAGVYMPRLSSEHHHRSEAAGSLELRMRGEFSIIGLVAGAFMLVAMPVLGPWLFGAGFSIPMPVWAAFGLLVFVRFVTAAFGVALTARRGVWLRVAGQGAGVLIIVLGMPTALVTLGIAGAPLTSTAALLTTLGVYWLALRWLDQRLQLEVAPR